MLAHPRAIMHTIHSKLLSLVLLTWACGDDDRADATANDKAEAGSIQPSHSEQAKTPATPDALPLDPSEVVDGRSHRDWAEAWVRWTNDATSCEEAFADEDGAWCANFQASEAPVFFMQMGDNETHRTQCVVPAGKYIFVPVLGMYDDDAAWDGPPRDEAQLEQDVTALLESMRDLSLRFDGVEPERDLSDYSIGGPYLMQYQLPPKPNIYSCNGTDVGDRVIDPVFFGGVFAVFPPPTVGQHVLEYGGTVTNPFGVPQRWHVKTEFSVEPP
jgi:hypothetical protein